MVNWKIILVIFKVENPADIIEQGTRCVFHGLYINKNRLVGR